jgi:hypothetical protein
MLKEKTCLCKRAAISKKLVWTCHYAGKWEIILLCVLTGTETRVGVSRYRDPPTIGDPDVMEGTNSSSFGIARVPVRFPSFWAEWPASWFTQAEAQFHLVGIRNELTKFYDVIAHVDEKYVV